MVVLLCAMFTYSYEEFTYLLLNTYGKTDKLGIFRTNYFTPSRFVLVKILLFISFIMMLIIQIKLNATSNYVSQKINSLGSSLLSFLKYLKEGYNRLTGYEKIVFYGTIVFIGLVKFYFLPRFPFHVDELSSYLFFVRKGIFVSMSYFPAPNNHILYSVIACIAQPFISDPFYLMKVPSCILSLMTSVVLFLFLFRNFSFSLSVLGTLLFSFTASYFIYSISGRGYALMTSFTIISSIATFEIISGRNENYLWHIYSISAILGFYTLFTFLYPLVSLSLAIGVYIIREKKYSLIKPFVFYSIVILLSVLLLYTPVFIISGFSAISSNAWMIKLDWVTYFLKLPQLLNGAFEFILGIETLQVPIGVFIIFSALAILIKTKRREWFWLIMFFFTTPIVLLTIQRLQPYNRVWIYLIFPMCMCMLIIFEYVFSLLDRIKYAKMVLALASSVAVVVYTLINFVGMTNHGYLMYDNVSRITSYIVKEKEVKVYTNDDSYNLFLRYESTRIGKDVVPDMTPLPASGSNFDYVLLTKKASFPNTLDSNKYILKEKDDYIVVYKRK